MAKPKPNKIDPISAAWLEPRGRVVYYRSNWGQKVSYRIKAANNVNIGSPSKGFRDLTDARRSFADLCRAIGADPTKVDEVVTFQP